MPPKPEQLVEVLTRPLGAAKLTPRQWTRIERFLDDWQDEVLAAARRHPPKSYDLGRAQVEAFAKLLGDLQGELPVGGLFGGPSETRRQAVAWQQTYLLNELRDALAKYVGQIKDALLYGMRLGVNPTVVASRLYNATHDANVNWRAITRTEMVRANAAGRLAACKDMGFDRVWAPPHAGACKRCRELLENRVFLISEVENVTNYGRAGGAWIPTIPLHPHCRHAWLPYDPDVFAVVQGEYEHMREAGLMDDENLDEWFDSSGQLKPEYSHVDFSAAKTMDAAALAACVWVAKRPRRERAFRERVDPGELRTDLYQRELDGDKVLDLVRRIRGGEQLPLPKVSLREDGTRYVYDGQHRAEAYRLLGLPIDVSTTRGMSWGEEHDACRELIGKVCDPLLLDVDEDLVAKVDGVSFASAPAEAANVGKAYLTRAEALAGEIFDVAAAPETLPSIEPITYGLDPLLFDGLRLRDDVRDHLQEAWARVAGPDWRTWSRLFLPVGDRPEVVIDYPALRAAHPEWAALADTDLHMALVILVLERTQAMELAPGVPLELRIRPEQTSAAYVRSVEAAADYGAVWSVDGQQWIGFVPQGVEKTADVAWAIDDDVAKQAAQAAPNTGVEHWITVHPHGESEPGQPVLVRNNSDGTMSVIGGAGGNLNYLRLDPKRRIDRDAGEKAKGADKVEQPVSEEEARQKEAEREQEVSAARERLEKAKALRGEHQQAMYAYVRDELGIDLESMDPKARRQMLTKLRTNSLRTLAYGPISHRDASEGADREDLGLDKPDAPKPLPGADDEPTPPGEQGPARPSMAMTDDHAKAIYDMLAQDRSLAGLASKENRVIKGEARGSDAAQVDWSPDGEDARDRKRAAAVEQQLRTDNARTLLSGGDDLKGADAYWNGKRGYEARYKSAFKQGGFDTIDAFSHSILGHGVMSKEAADLLGVAGAAQLAAHAIQQEAMERGKEGVDLEKVTKALEDLTGEQERALTDRGLNRIRNATSRAAQAQAEIPKSEAGESLYTTTMARSIASQKLQEAKRALGMMIGGLETCSALKVALERKAGEKIKVGGFTSPATIKELAAKAGVKITAADISRVGAGNYTLSVEPQRLQKLIRRDADNDAALREQLRGIRSASDLDAKVDAARTGPGMSDQLDANQARGKLFLQAAGSGLLAFDPGVGKTHVAIATAMEKMAAEPGKHRALIVVPTNMARSWASTIQSQGSGHSVKIVGQSETSPEKDTSSTSAKHAQLTDGADFTIISYESLRSYKDVLKRHAAEHGPDGAHSIVIADELQKAKNENTGNFGGVQSAVELAREHHGDSASFMGLTGTPIEKDVGDVGAMMRLVKTAKGEQASDRATLRSRAKGMGEEHIARGDKVAAFREGLDTGMFRLSAKDAGNDLGEPERSTHQVKLTDTHREALLDRVNTVNQMQRDYLERKEAGELRINSKTGKPESGVAFGGRDMLMDALYNHPDNSITKSVVDEIEKTGSFHFPGMSEDHDPGPDGGEPKYHKGDFAGDYEHKHVVFGANETSQALFGRDEAKGGFDKEGKGGLAGELRKRGIKVFIGHGGMSNAQNDANYKAFVAHKGKAVFVTNDKNNAGISLQFGDNKGAFQHGATHLHHFTRPVNNATIQQREARILRKGAQAGAHYHTYSADTPVEQRLQETLEDEARTQDLAANSDQRVAGKDTLRSKLGKKFRAAA